MCTPSIVSKCAGPISGEKMLCTPPFMSKCCGLVMKKKGEQKSMTSVGASLTLDYREKEENNNPISHV